MLTARTCAILGACAAMAFGISSVGASVISFDPDGLGILPAVNVGSLDLLPGSSIDQNISPGGVPTVGATTTILYQARLGSLLDSSGNVITVPGLNDSTAAHPFQITAVAQFNATITGQTGGATPTTTLALAPGLPNFITYYYNGALTADDLTGTGFTDGTQIATGSVNIMNSVFITISALGTSNFDSFGADNYSGLQTINGIGGTAFSADNLTLNPNFFLTPGITQLMGNSTNALAYNAANPSQKFFGTVSPNLGAVNGLSGPDIELQTDGVTSFVVTVPEPASLFLLAAGASTLLTRRRRR